MQCRETGKWIMLIERQLDRAREAGRLLGSVSLRPEGASFNILISESPYLDFRLREGQPCYIEDGRSSLSGVYLGRNRLGQLRFEINTSMAIYDSFDNAEIVPLTEKFLQLASRQLSEDTPSSNRLEAFLRLIEGGESCPWKEHAARLAKEDGISIVWGPPGCGKTTYIARKAEQKLLSDKSVLVLSSNNAALHSFMDACSNVPVSYLNEDNEEQPYVSVSTFAKLLLSCSDISGRFDTVIVDEVSTARIPELMIAALAARNEVILIGDYMQLGVIADDEVARTLLEKDIFSYLSIPQDADPQCDILTILKRQNRMRPGISSFISRHFYHGLLEDGHLEFRSYRTSLKKIFPAAIEAVDISSLWSAPSVTSTLSHMNMVSAVITAALAAKWAEDTSLSVAVLTPYTAQSSLITMLVTELYRKSHVTVSTVHALQGREADIVIFDSVDSFPFTKAGRLFDEPYDEFPSPLDRFVNVALSRAREKFIIISDFEFFRIHARGTVFEELLKSAGNSDDRVESVLKVIQSRVLAFGIPGRERNARYEKSWSMRRRFFAEVAESSERTNYTFFFADRDKISSYQRAMVSKAADSGRSITFCYRSAEKYHYAESFTLTDAWKESHPDVVHKALPAHQYLYALTFAEETRHSADKAVRTRFIWYGALHPSYPSRGRSVPIFRMMVTSKLSKFLKYIR